MRTKNSCDGCARDVEGEANSMQTSAKRASSTDQSLSQACVVGDYVLYPSDAWEFGTASSLYGTHLVTTKSPFASLCITQEPLLQPTKAILIARGEPWLSDRAYRFRCGLGGGNILSALSLPSRRLSDILTVEWAITTGSDLCQPSGFFHLITLIQQTKIYQLVLDLGKDIAMIPLVEQKLNILLDTWVPDVRSGEDKVEK